MKIAYYRYKKEGPKKSRSSRTKNLKSRIVTSEREERKKRRCLFCKTNPRLELLLESYGEVLLLLPAPEERSSRTRLGVYLTPTILPS